MATHDPRFDPENAPIITDDVYPSFARRTVSTIFTLAIIAVAVVFFMGWMSRGSPDVNAPTPAPIAAAPAAASGTTGGRAIDLKAAVENAVEPAAGVSEEPLSNALYNFFRTFFEKIKVAVTNENDAVPLPAIQTVSYTPLPMVRYQKLPVSSGSGEVLPRQGTVLDDQGHIAGAVQAVLYQANHARQIYFLLDPALNTTQQDRIFGLSYDAARLSENQGILNIQLTPDQTAALAQQSIPP